MRLFSHVELPKSFIDISYHDLIMMFGSCFAENMGKKFIEHKFQVDLNPFGIIYNPESISLSIRRLMENRLFDNNVIFPHEGQFHSFEHHSCFSEISKESCLQKINERFTLSAGNLQKTTKLFVTFGTAYVYRLKETGQVVTNCHKLSANLFVRERLTITQIVTNWEKLLTVLFDRNKKLVLIFTVSPVRYWQDGVHENQVSKSILLLAIEELQARFLNRIIYFPAYELMMDELRDYRFYADDLIHPSDTAIQYIWERFEETYMNEQTRQLMHEVRRISKALNHRPLNPNSESHKQFIAQTLIQIERLNEKMPSICFENI